jgi:hypothetical protein
MKSSTLIYDCCSKLLQMIADVFFARKRTDLLVKWGQFRVIFTINQEISKKKLEETKMCENAAVCKND